MILKPRLSAMRSPRLEATIPTMKRSLELFGKRWNMSQKVNSFDRSDDVSGCSIQAGVDRALYLMGCFRAFCYRYSMRRDEIVWQKIGSLLDRGLMFRGSYEVSGLHSRPNVLEVWLWISNQLEIGRDGTRCGLLSYDCSANFVKSWTLDLVKPAKGLTWFEI